MRAAQHAAHGAPSDIKPCNILLSEDFTTVKLADYGLAHAISASMSKVSSARGTPLYIAPELADDPSPSVGSDMFSFGMTAWQVTPSQLHRLIPPLIRCRDCRRFTPQSLIPSALCPWSSCASWTEASVPLSLESMLHLL